MTMCKLILNRHIAECNILHLKGPKSNEKIFFIVVALYSIRKNLKHSKVLNAFCIGTKWNFGQVLYAVRVSV